jgi:glucose-inhibited division protein A
VITLPQPHEVGQLVEGLLGRDVTSVRQPEPTLRGKDVRIVGSYVDDAGSVRAVALVDVVLGNALGAALATHHGIVLNREANALDLLRRPELDYAALAAIDGFGPAVADADVAAQVEVQTKYAGYLERQREDIARRQRHEATVIPGGFDYDRVRGLSAEVLGKLKHAQPRTIGQAARISGVTPAAISLLLVHLKRRHAA